MRRLARQLACASEKEGGYLPKPFRKGIIEISLPLLLFGLQRPPVQLLPVGALGTRLGAR
jgi:hypothetical protein